MILYRNDFLGRILKKNKHLWGVGICLIFFIGIIIYSNTFNSPFLFDDEQTVTKNTILWKPFSIKTFWAFSKRRIITHLTFALNYKLHRLDVFGYHIVNLVIHILSAVLVFVFTRLTFSSPEIKKREIAAYRDHIAVLAGLIFVSHPLQIQAVTYITQRATSLATLFYLASLCSYVMYRLSQGSDVSPRGRIVYVFIFSISTLLGIFTKEIMITLPLTIMLYETCFFRGRGFAHRKIICAGLFTLMLAFVCLVLFQSVDFGKLAETMRSSHRIPPGHYILTQFRVFVTYFRLLFLPINMNFDYDYPIVAAFSVPLLGSICLIGFILFFAAKIFANYRIVSFGIFWFFITLLPELTLIPVYFFLTNSSRDVIFHYRLYLPIVGFTFFAAGGIYYLCGRRRKILVAASVILISYFSTMTYQRNAIWKDELTFWNDVVAKSPAKARPYNGRGIAYGAKRDLDEAIEDFSKAISIRPTYADAYLNRGLMFNEKGDFDRAIKDFTRVIKMDPGYPEAYYYRGNIYHSQAKYEEAVTDYTKAIEWKTDFFEAHYNIALICQRRGLLGKAVSSYTSAIHANPYYADAYNNRGLAYQTQGDLIRAVSDFTQAIRIDPGFIDAYKNRAVAFFLEKNYNKSWKDIDQVKRLGGRVHPGFLKTLKQESGTN